MSEPDGNPPNPQASEQENSLPGPTPLKNAPRANPPTIFSQRETPQPPDGPPNIQDFLRWFGGLAGTQAPAASASRTTLPKEKKKFQRRDPEARGDKPESPALPPVSSGTPEPATAPESTTVAAVKNDGDEDAPGSGKTGPASEKGVIAPTPLTPRTRVGKPTVKSPIAFWAYLQLGVLALLVLCFFLGRASVSTTPDASNVPKGPVVTEGDKTHVLISPESADLIDKALAAEQNGDFAASDAFFQQVVKSGEHVPGLDYQMAMLATATNNPRRAMELLNRSIIEDEEVAASYNLRGTVLSRRGAALLGLADLETATRLDPYGARYFYFWGEALRRMGKPQTAVLRLQQAIDRLREPELESLYRLKLRLAQIEANQEGLFADELAKQLALPIPPPDYLFTAAAVQMHRGDFDAAAQYLSRAASVLPTDAFDRRLFDYYLYGFKYHKEVARFYNRIGAIQAPEPEATPAAEGSLGKSSTSSQSTAPLGPLAEPKVPVSQGADVPASRGADAPASQGANAPASPAAPALSAPAASASPSILPH